MVLPQSFTATLLLLAVTMLCWGSWANTFKLAGPKWRFELFYFDFCFGVILAALVYAFTFGTLGFDGFLFMDDLYHTGRRQIFFGAAAGVIFNLGNMLLVAAISVAGLAVAFPIGLGTALATGTLASYIIRPQGHPMLLFAGLGLIVVSLIFAVLAYRVQAASRLGEEIKKGNTKSTFKTVSLKGIILSLIGGLLMGLFFPLVDFAKRGEFGLGPYAISFVFALGIFLSTFVFNLFFMNLPVQGEPLEILDYFTMGGLKQHLLGFLGGLIWYTGTLASHVAAGAEKEAQAGPALTSAISQGATIVGALWGLLVWKEFAGADSRARFMLGLMITLFLGGLALVSIAPLYPPVR